MIGCRKFTLLIVSIFLSNVVSSQNCLKYKIVSIGSTKSTYLIRVKHKKYKGLIESPKRNLSSAKSINKIALGKKYKLILKKSSLTFIRLGVKHAVYIDDKKVWSNNSNYDLLETKDLNGLYIADPYSCGCKR